MQWLAADLTRRAGERFQLSEKARREAPGTGQSRLVWQAAGLAACHLLVGSLFYAKSVRMGTIGHNQPFAASGKIRPGAVVRLCGNPGQPRTLKAAIRSRSAPNWRFTSE